MQDEFLDLDEITLYEDASVFELEPKQISPYTFDDDVMANISIEMNLDLKFVSREGYTILDLISDIGGIQGIMLSFLAYVLSIFNYNLLENYMVSKLFTSESDGQEKTQEKLDRMKGQRCQSLKEYFANLAQVICGRPKCCGKLSKRERYFDRAREQLGRETCIIEMIRSHRFIIGALKKLLTQDEYTEIMKNSRYISID